MVDIATLLQFLAEGDYLGLLQAVYVAAFLSVDLFYGMLALLFTSPLYIRTKSLLLMATLYILLGSFFLVAMPIVAGLGLFLIIMALAATFFKVFISIRS